MAWQRHIFPKWAEFKGTYTSLNILATNIIFLHVSTTPTLANIVGTYSLRYFITLGRSSETKHSMGTELRRQRRGWTRRWIYEIYKGSSIHHHRRCAHRKRRIMFQRSPIVNSLSRIILFVEFHPLPLTHRRRLCSQVASSSDSH